MNGVLIMYHSGQPNAIILGQMTAPQLAHFALDIYQRIFTFILSPTSSRSVSQAKSEKDSGSNRVTEEIERIAEMEGKQMPFPFSSSSFPILHILSFSLQAVLHYHRSEHVFHAVYASVSNPDVKTERLKVMVPLWRHVYGLSARQIAEVIRADRIDILVELTGHMAGCRLDVMALQPAPIQMTWIDMGFNSSALSVSVCFFFFVLIFSCSRYPNTTGLPTIQYRITDAIADPPDTKQQFVEELLRLPGCFLCYQVCSLASSFCFSDMWVYYFVRILVYCSLLKSHPLLLSWMHQR